MSKIALTPNANGSGVFTLASPNSNTNRTITLPDESVTLGAGTPSIDDNGNATALTIDSSENVLIGRTDSGSQTEGTTIYNGGTIEVTNASDLALRLNRKTNDGTIIELRKDAGVVGSIQSRAGSMTSLVLNPSGSDGAGFTGGSNAILPVSASALVDNTIDLGVGSYRYNDLFLGGGVYLGGTGSANKLDDYEEGTWTPTATSGGSFSNNAGSYTKIGNVVTLHATFIVGSNSSGLGFGITGLPFNQASANAAAGFYIRYTSDSTYRMFYLSDGNVISVYNLGGGAATFGSASTGRYDFSGVYYTNS